MPETVVVSGWTSTCPFCREDGAIFTVDSGGTARARCATCRKRLTLRTGSDGVEWREIGAGQEVV